MEHLYIRSHPPWYARGSPVVKLRDGPHAKIRGKPSFVIREGPQSRGKPPDKIGLWVQNKKVFFSRQKWPVQPMVCPICPTDLSTFAELDNVKIGSVNFLFNADWSTDAVRLGI